MEKFFEHLRENLEAIQSDGTGEIDQPERRRMTSGEAPASSERMHTHEVNSSPGKSEFLSLFYHEIAFLTSAAAAV